MLQAKTNHLVTP
jgi:hypothetical protein